MSLTRPTVDVIRMNTDWDGYLKVLEAAEGNRLRITYDRGRLELVTPSYKHEWTKTTLSSLLETLMHELDVDFIGGGSLTFQRQDLDRGLEPDECYWVTRWAALKGVDEYDPLVHPPPDLVIEVDVSRSSMDRIEMYRTMGVPEVWRSVRKKKLHIYRLASDGSYQTVPESPLFPGLTPAVLLRFLERARELSHTGLAREFRAWVRQQLG